MPFADRALCETVRRHASLGVWILSTPQELAEAVSLGADVIETTGSLKPCCRVKFEELKSFSRRAAETQSLTDEINSDGGHRGNARNRLPIHNHPECGSHGNIHRKKQASKRPHNGVPPYRPTVPIQYQNGRDRDVPLTVTVVVSNGTVKDKRSPPEQLVSTRSDIRPYAPQKEQFHMKSLRELYRIGKGPSSSHTMGPRKAAETFLKKNPGAASFNVTLYGSLAATGKGHLTDKAILDVLEPVAPVHIDWQAKTVLPFHPNGMNFRALDKDGRVLDKWTVFSIGGGALAEEGKKGEDTPDVYDMGTIMDILRYCRKNGRTLWEYVEQCEGPGIWDFLREVWQVMRDAVERGIVAEGVLPGPLHLQRKAATYHIKASGYTASLHSRGLVFAYALAVSEENAGGGTIVTAPTCGSCGVLPGVLYHLWKSRNFPENRILHALATGGLIGNIAKHSASISGAEAGCQAEVGVACAMASAASCQLFGGSPKQIEYAAEMGLEHHLGLTCDPICGLVQVPCIERNAYAAARAMDCNIFASFTDGNHLVSYDRILEVMMQTGKDLPSIYRETSEGGMAKDYKQME